MEKKTLLLTLVIGIMTGTGFGLTVYDPNYRGEVWLEYSSSEIGGCTDFTFGDEGKIYTSHSVLPERYNDPPIGSIYVVTPDKQVNVLLTGLRHPRKIVWPENSLFTEGLLIANQYYYNYDPYNNGPTEILKLLPDGTVSTVVERGALYNFKGMAMGQGVIHGQSLYVAKENYIARLYPGSNWPDQYAYLPNAYEAESVAMAFDTAGTYGGHMFAAIDNYYFYSPQPTGLLKIVDQGWQAQTMPYSSQIELACGIAFDTTSQQEFSGAMYVIERRRGETQWSLSRVIGPEKIELVAVFDKHTTDMTPPRIQFGADGSLYAMEANTAAEMTVISRVFKFKTPLELAIEHLSHSIARDQQLLEGIEFSLHEKLTALENLETALASDELAIKKAESQRMLRELNKAVISEQNAHQNLLDSIENMETLLPMISIDPD